MLIGREKETAILEKAFSSNEAEMVSVVGRRRVGKTFLVRTAYKGKIDFEMSGVQDADGKEQLRNFANQLKLFSGQTLVTPPKDWLDAFFILIDYLNTIEKNEKLVVFFDEVPWMATHKSGFLKGLSYFWNSWAVQRNIVVVLCGSAASWIIQKILRNKGGLHNRVTRRIMLKPFSLHETEQYLLSRKVNLSRFQIIQVYMAIGGIPHYLKEIEHGVSAVQTIQKLCFEESGLLKDEFLNLYPALFDQSQYHESIIRALAKKHSGLTRTELVKASGLPDGGRISTVLSELNESGFISPYTPFGKRKKGTIYRLTDAYSLFYLRFIEPYIKDESVSWLALSQKQSYKTWCGYAFENLCLSHIQQVKKALKIEGIHSVATSFYQQGTAEKQGIQIDLLIDRADQTINICELKFHTAPFIITKSYADQLRTKMEIFRTETKTSKMLLLTFISALGILENKNSIGLVSKSIEMDAFFERI